MIKRWLVFDIGCIECGEESGVIGTFDTEEEADAVSDAAKLLQRKVWSGEHHFEIYDLSESSQPEESHPEWEACKA